MSATANPSANADSTDDLSKEERLKQYLLDRAQDGEMYFKGKFIADDVDLSPKEIGALMVKLRDSATELTVEKWSYTGATTWRIEPA
jgi:CRP-like cAMP-binding protein